MPWTKEQIMGGALGLEHLMSSYKSRLKANPMADYVKQMTPMPFTLTNEDMQGNASYGNMAGSPDDHVEQCPEGAFLHKSSSGASRVKDSASCDRLHLSDQGHPGDAPPAVKPTPFVRDQGSPSAQLPDANPTASGRDQEPPDAAASSATPSASGHDQGSPSVIAPSAKPAADAAAQPAVPCEEPNARDVAGSPSRRVGQPVLSKPRTRLVLEKLLGVADCSGPPACHQVHPQRQQQPQPEPQPQSSSQAGGGRAQGASQRRNGSLATGSLGSAAPGAEPPVSGREAAPETAVGPGADPGAYAATEQVAPIAHQSACGGAGSNSPTGCAEEPVRNVPQTRLALKKLLGVANGAEARAGKQAHPQPRPRQQPNVQPQESGRAGRGLGRGCLEQPAVNPAADDEPDASDEEMPFINTAEHEATIKGWLDGAKFMPVISKNKKKPGHNRSSDKQGTLQHILAKRTSELFAALQAKERKKGHEAQTHRASLVAIERHGRFAVLLIISNKRGRQGAIDARRSKKLWANLDLVQEWASVRTKPCDLLASFCGKGGRMHVMLHVNGVWDHHKVLMVGGC